MSEAERFVKMAQLFKECKIKDIGGDFSELPKYSAFDTKRIYIYRLEHLKEKAHRQRFAIKELPQFEDELK